LVDGLDSGKVLRIPIRGASVGHLLAGRKPFAAVPPTQLVVIGAPLLKVS
jgi:hypothetical protein